MGFFEDKLRPHGRDASWRRDLLVPYLLIALTVAMVPPWSGDVLGEMTSFYLLPAMGFALALRCGAIDLSVWASAAVGGVVAVALINTGASTVVAFVAGVLAGGAMELVNAAMVILARVPSVVSTFITAVVTTLIMTHFTPGRALWIDEPTFTNWLVWPHVSVEMVRRIVVAGGYSLVMLTLCWADSVGSGGIRLGPRASLLAVLCASGALSGLAGASWLLNHGNAPLLSRPVGDPRLCAAAVLAGSALFLGRGRTMLAGLCLPPALLIATIWQQEVWVALRWRGYALGSGLLVGLTGIAHLAAAVIGAGPRTSRRLAAGSFTLAVTAIIVLTISIGSRTPADRNVYHFVSIVLAVTAGAALLAGKIILPRARDVRRQG